MMSRFEFGMYSYDVTTGKRTMESARKVFSADGKHKSIIIRGDMYATSEVGVPDMFLWQAARDKAENEAHYSLRQIKQIT